MERAGSLPSSSSVMVPLPVPSASLAPTGPLNATVKSSVSSSVSSSRIGTRIGAVSVLSAGSKRSVPTAGA